MSKIEINLMKYANDTAFSVGDHTITVKAVANDYADSNASGSTTVTAFAVDICGTADNPSSTSKVETYKFVCAPGTTLAELVDNTDWSELGYRLWYTDDAQEMVVLTDNNGDYTLNIPATDTVEGKTYSAQWTTIYTQLATPTDVAVDASTLSFTAVEHATSYEIYADGTSIGTHTP